MHVFDFIDTDLGTTIVTSLPKKDSVTVPEFSLIEQALNSLKPTAKKSSCVKIHSC